MSVYTYTPAKGRAWLSHRGYEPGEVELARRFWNHYVRIMKNLHRQALLDSGVKMPVTWPELVRRSYIYDATSGRVQFGWDYYATLINVLDEARSVRDSLIKIEGGE